MKARQKGGSAIITLILLAALAYGVFLAIQYIPIRLESGSVDSILESLERGQKQNPARTVPAVEDKISHLLNVNQMNDMKHHFYTTKLSNTIVVEVKYERELNLGWETRKIVFDKSISLR